MLGRGAQGPPQSGICGQAPSNYPQFAAFLVERRIGSISVDPNRFIVTKKVVPGAERRSHGRSREKQLRRVSEINRREIIRKKHASFSFGTNLSFGIQLTPFISNIQNINSNCTKS